ncbi:beta-lactamase family protein [Muricauda sp. CAU 1633]|uniref:serine hydrolase domain-containing protein n=1 Tax=Allomuricauda sp. CAU 1633 TaxID=2816036 RepID=UPI001A8D2236|nr:serine hydrolase domain-containing protein [Muricauda sp. CAU 1633]MBO0322225.1 beta-lactamase family protein [Muricauda sp. CAU 1633]
MKSAIQIFILLTLCSCTQNQKTVESNSNDQGFPESDYIDFSLEKSKKVHQRFNDENWDDFESWALQGDASRYIYLHFSEFWPHTIIKAGQYKKCLPIHLREDVAQFQFALDKKDFIFKNYINNSPTNGAIVIHKGNIIFESYPRMLPDDKHTYMSISKILVSLSVGILIDQGKINTEDPVEVYIPELKGSHAGKIKVIDFLDMTSGLDCVPSESHGGDCFKKSLLVWGWPNTSMALENPLEYFAEIASHRPAGEVFEYADINPLILSALIEEVSGQKYSNFIEQEIWKKSGAMSDAVIMNAAFGRSASPLGFSSTLRDLARLGMLYTPSGRRNNNPVVSTRHLEAIQMEGRPKLLLETKSTDWFTDNDSNTKNLLYGEPIKHETYQWEFVMEDGDFWKAGFGGSGLYVSPKKDLVIAYFGSKDENNNENKLPLISRMIAKSDLFN